MSPPLLFSLDPVDFFWAGRGLLTDIGWRPYRGEQCAILGSNGAGKPALLAGLAGRLAIRRGTLTHQFLEPDLLLLDEPAQGLDAEHGAWMKRPLEGALAQRRTSLV